MKIETKDLINTRKAQSNPRIQAMEPMNQISKENSIKSKSKYKSKQESVIQLQGTIYNIKSNMYELPIIQEQG
jgi:hypothetical protein